MNLDQRSLHINNEIGIFFLNPELAGKRAEEYHRNIEKIAFRLVLNTGSSRESIRWHLKQDEGEIIYDKEPYVGFWKKFGVWFIGLLPIEHLL